MAMLPTDLALLMKFPMISTMPMMSATGASVEGWKKAYTRMQQQYNDQPAEKVVNLGGAYSYAKESIPRTVVEKTVPHLFEGKLFQVPEGYDAFLRNCYGDYMQLPPEEQRVGRHEIVGIDFGAYQIRFVGQENTVGDDQ